MGTEDLINISASSCSGGGNEIKNLRSNFEPSEVVSLPGNAEVKEDKLNGEIPGNNEGDVGDIDSQPLLETYNDKDLVDSTAILQIGFELTEATEVKEKMNCFSSTMHTENGCLTAQDGCPLGNHKRDGSPISSHEIDGSSISGVKRPRTTIDEQQPSVHVVYNSLTRDGKRKLEELLQQWSEWHARHHSSSHDSNELLQSGEETYFPALHVGLDKPSAVSFWMDNQPRNPLGKEFIPLDSNSVPLYDRGYASLTSTDGLSNLEQGMETVDASRCFNCASYNHSLKECPKPRDNVAVNNARKEHKSRRHLNSSSRNPTRYYQNTPGGKYDGLRPGVLDAETRQLLGLGELDPPPWLNRMREIGYPPGYLDPEDEDQPSGITIFSDEESKEEKEDGEILDTDYHPELPRKMSVEFPGINAPIPENADERRWTAVPSNFDPSRNRSHRRSNHSSEPTSKGHYHEQRWSRDIRDDGPPGVDPGTSPSISGYSPRYGSYDSSYTSYSPRGDISIPKSPSFGRPVSDRGRRSPLVHETSSNHGSYSSLPCSPPNRLLAPQNYGSVTTENRDSDRWKDFTPVSSSHHRHKYDTHHRHSRR